MVKFTKREEQESQTQKTVSKTIDTTWLSQRAYAQFWKMTNLENVIPALYKVVKYDKILGLIFENYNIENKVILILSKKI